MAQQPEVTRPRHRQLRDRRRLLLARIGRPVVQQRIQFRSVEAQVPEIDPEFPEIRHLQRQKFPVPTRLFRQPACRPGI